MNLWRLIFTFFRIIILYGIFVIILRQYLDKILKKYFFYIWNENGPVVRLMTSFDTREEDIDNFIDTVKKAVKN